MDWQNIFFSGNGRMGRTDFWISYLILFGLSSLLGWFPPIGLAALYSTVCLFSKRLHDAGRSAWLMLIPLGVTTVVIALSAMVFGGVIIAGVMGHSPPVEGTIGIAIILGIFGLCLLCLMINLAFLVWVGVSSPTAGDNRFGALPTPIFNRAQAPGPTGPPSAAT